MQVVQSELRRVPRELTHNFLNQMWSIVYVPQIGHLVQISGQPLGADILDALPDFSSVLESTNDDGNPVHYYKGQCTTDLDHEFGDMHNKIQDMEVISLCLINKLKKLCAVSTDTGHLNETRCEGHSIPPCTH